jgi:hypothetical protein
MCLLFLIHARTGVPRKRIGMSDAAPAENSSQVVCPAAKDPAVRSFIFAAITLSLGLYCFYDHYVAGKYQLTDKDNINVVVTYSFNHYGPFLLVPLGLVILVKGIGQLRRVLVADDAGFGYVGKRKIPWSAVTGLDKSKFDKGLLGLHYADGENKGKFMLDNLALRNYRALIALVDQKVSAKREG